MSRIFRRDAFPVAYGKYSLIERIGFGGMAEVFKARLAGAAGFQKTLVIKRILPQLADSDDIVERFIAEAKLLASVEHKNIVSVYELGQAEDGEYFIAMELVDGADVLALLRRAAQNSLRIPVSFSIHVVAEVLSGLAHAHQQRDEQGRPLGIIHRDVSPSNVFVSRQGAVKLGDFGVAKTHDLRRTTQAGAGAVKGKIEYTAPELLFGRAPPDARIDIFGAGVMLWELLTQRRLFGADNDYQIARQLRSAERPRPSRYQPDVPSALDEEVLRALSADPAGRPSSAREMGRALREIGSELTQRSGADDNERVVRTLLGEAEGAALAALSSEHRGFRGGFPALKSFAIYYIDPAESPEIDDHEETLDVAPKDSTPPPDAGVEFDDQKTVIDPRALAQEGPDFADDEDVYLVQPVDETPALDEDVWVELSAIGTSVTSKDIGPSVRVSELIDDLVLTEDSSTRPRFWLAGTEGEIRGPEEIGAVLAPLSTREMLQISLDGEAWRTMDLVLGEEEPPQLTKPVAGAITGTFPRQSPVLLFCRLARASASGTVIAEGIAQDGRLWSLSVTLALGRIVHVASTRSGDGLLELLLATRGLSLDDAAKLLSSAISRGQSLLERAEAMLSVPRLELRTELYRHRLRALFSRGGARFRFVASGAPERAEPTVDVRPILAELLLEADPSALRGAGLAQLSGQRLAFAQAFVREIRGFRLTRAQDRFLMALAEGRRPELGSDAREEVAIVTVLVASGLLLHYPAQ